MIKKTAAIILCAFFMIIMFNGCGADKNSEIVGKWVPTTASLNGSTVQYRELGIDEDQFSFTFESDGKCSATLAGIEGEGTYVFNETSVDVVINDETQRLNYDNGNLTLTLNYDNNTTSFTFTKVR